MSEAQASTDKATVERQIFEKWRGLHAATRVECIHCARKARAEVVVMARPWIVSEGIKQRLELAHCVQIASIKGIGLPSLAGQAVAL